jgi:hypothetical protein
MMKLWKKLQPLNNFLYLLIVLSTLMYHICSPVVMLLDIIFTILPKSDNATEKSTLKLGVAIWRAQYFV